MPFQLSPQLSLQQGQFSQRLLNSGSFLPGLGAFGPASAQRAKINLTPQIRTERSYASNPGAHAKDNPFLLPAVNSGGKVEKNPFGITNVVDAGDGKCTYVQMKGGPLPTGECQKGGMACEKVSTSQISYDLRNFEL